jgi:hypothetical protein
MTANKWQSAPPLWATLTHSTTTTTTTTTRAVVTIVTCPEAGSVGQRAAMKEDYTISSSFDNKKPHFQKPLSLSLANSLFSGCFQGCEIVIRYLGTQYLPYWPCIGGWE